jgi:hypothetical protein
VGGLLTREGVGGVLSKRGELEWKNLEARVWVGDEFFLTTVEMIRLPERLRRSQQACGRRGSRLFL